MDEDPKLATFVERLKATGIVPLPNTRLQDDPQSTGVVSLQPAMVRAGFNDIVQSQALSQISPEDLATVEIQEQLLSVPSPDEVVLPMASRPKGPYREERPVSLTELIGHLCFSPKRLPISPNARRYFRPRGISNYENVGR
jgi:hypothetical protein